MTRYGGLHLVANFIKQIGFRRILSWRIPFPQRNNRYSFSDMLLALIYPMMLGLKRIETTALLKTNGVFQYLTGLPQFPDPTALRRFLFRMGSKGIQQLKAIHDKFLAFMFRNFVKLIFDMDSTVVTVYGRLEGARKGYNPFKKGRPSYHPLFCFEGQTQDYWHGEWRMGNVFTGEGTIPCVEAVLGKVPAKVKRIFIRADVGFFSGENLDFFEEKEILYVVVARLYKDIQNKILGLKYQDIGAGITIVEFSYQLHRWKKKRRFIVVRKRLPEEHSDIRQLTLFHTEGYSYHVYVTNLPWRPKKVYSFYNQRASAELIIKELKGDWPLAKIPTKHWISNESYFHVLLFAYKLMQWFKRLALPKTYHKRTLQSIQNELINIPAELVHPKGQPKLKLPANSPYREIFLFAQNRISKLKSFTSLYK